MSRQLKKSVQVWKLARDLGLRPTDDPVSDILRFCERKIGKFLKDFPDCNSLSEVLDCVAARAGTIFEIARSDSELSAIREKYLKKGEKIFAWLHEELSPDVFGTTFRLASRELWEPQFVSVIDCRGPKATRSYFTKWHEIAHLLTLTDQLRLSFQRTHSPSTLNAPEEALMEVIAGCIGFYPAVARRYINGGISFEAIEKMRSLLCPEASQQSSLIGFVNAWPKPCFLIRAELALRRSEEIQSVQLGLDFAELPIPVLRAVRVTANDAARQENLIIFENMRVPDVSVIQRVFAGETIHAEAVENLSWWETSDGTRLPNRPVRVEAKRSWHSVDALIIPL